jgi:hypothetical protein
MPIAPEGADLTLREVEADRMPLETVNTAFALL